MHCLAPSWLAKCIYDGEGSLAMQMARVSSPLSPRPQLGHCSSQDTPAVVKCLRNLWSDLSLCHTGFFSCPVQLMALLPVMCTIALSILAARVRVFFGVSNLPGKTCAII